MYTHTKINCIAIIKKTLTKSKVPQHYSLSMPEVDGCKYNKLSIEARVTWSDKSCHFTK